MTLNEMIQARADELLNQFAAENDGRVLFASPIPRTKGEIVQPTNARHQPVRIIEPATMEDWTYAQKRAGEIDRTYMPVVPPGAYIYWVEAD